MTPKHTAGPWTLGQNDTVVFDSRSNVIAAFQDSKPQTVANAQLIAAAPELLEACKALLAHLPYGNEALQIKALAAIAKATEVQS